MAQPVKSKIAGQALFRLHSSFSENTITYGLALIVGLLAGVGAYALHHLLIFFEWLAFTEAAGRAGAYGRYLWFVFPALGLLLVYPIVKFIEPQARGDGVPEVMEAVARRGGHMRGRLAAAKAVCSSLTIGMGGSAGVEGPIVQIGSSLGSSVAQAFRMSDKRVINLVACGAAGGVSAIFNAPIAGVFFALEVVIGNISANYVGPIIMSSVVSAVFIRGLLGESPTYIVPTYSLNSPWEMLLYGVLGVIMALAAILMIKSIYAAEKVFSKWNAGPVVKAVAGGVSVGAIGFFLRQAAGSCVSGIESALRMELPLAMMLLLFAARLAATSLTLGAGGSGGVFAPSLFMGAMLGGAFGALVNAWFPAVTAPLGAYAVVGMAAMFGSASCAPITAALIVFEVTADYSIILPLLLTVSISALIVQRILGDSIYSMKLTRKGINFKGGFNVNLLETIHVAEVMETVVQFVSDRDTVDSVRELLETTEHQGFPVLDRDGRLCGIICGSDVRRAMSAGRGRDPVSAVATRHVITASPDETVYEALKRFGSREMGRLPVVDPADPSRVVGLITRADILEAYQRAQLLDASRGED